MPPRRGSVTTLVWMLVWLVALDVGAGLVFPPRAATTGGLRGALARYFDHGRSIETRLRAALEDDDPSTRAMLEAGWIDPRKWADQPARPKEGQRHLVAIYGNSFARQIGRHLAALDPEIGIRMIFGPVAPPSHSHAAFVADLGQHDADVVVLGVVSSTVVGVLSMTRATHAIAEPFPYTYPRYRIEEGRLESEPPVIDSLDAMRAALEGPELLSRYTDQLARSDVFYSPLLFRESLLDHSTLARLLKNAWAIRSQREVEARVHGPEGFVPGTEAIDVFEALLRDFAARARAAGRRPVVLAMSRRGYDDDLDRWLADRLGDGDVPVVYAGDVCSAGAPSSFADDGHYSDACADGIAAALRDFVRGGAAETGR